MSVVVAIDAGTTGIRASAIDADGVITAYHYEEFTQHFPEPGWVEHDANEIWAVTLKVLDALPIDAPVAAIGITNQRETVVAWDRSTGEPLHRAIVWQDRRTADYCESLIADGHLDRVRSITGLVLDPYFSATKMRWLLNDGGVTATADLALGTIDAWLLYKLTDGAVFATEASNACRTLLFDIGTMDWSAEMCDLFEVPIAALPAVKPSSGRFGVTTDTCPLGADIPISGIAGDQQAALFGQACFSVGAIKNTYGTGSFVVMNAGTTKPPAEEGLLTSIAWQIEGQDPVYMVEGAVFVTGAAIQWLRDGLGMIAEATELEGLAQQCDDTGGVVFVPALTGLGSPYWDPYARGTIVGITRGTGRPEIARAVIESIVHQSADVVEAMAAATGAAPTLMRVDGGASAMDTMLQLQADMLNVVVDRPRIQQTTAMGAAYLAGLAEGVWESLDQIAELWHREARFEPRPGFDPAPARAIWRQAVERSRGWALVTGD